MFGLPHLHLNTDEGNYQILTYVKCHQQPIFLTEGEFIRIVPLTGIFISITTALTLFDACILLSVIATQEIAPSRKSFDATSEGYL